MCLSIHRDGVDDMTAALAWRAIPTTIFCAGYGNVAMEVLRRGSPKITGPGGVFTPHLRLVANFFRVRMAGKAEGGKGWGVLGVLDTFESV